MDTAFFGLLTIIGVSSYFLPTIAARIRTAKRSTTIFFVNLAFGWTIIGWIAALIWAVRQQSSVEAERPVASPVDSDNWFFDPPKFNERSTVEQIDHWILGTENLFKSPHKR